VNFIEGVDVETFELLSIVLNFVKDVDLVPTRLNLLQMKMSKTSN